MKEFDTNSHKVDVCGTIFEMLTIEEFVANTQGSDLYSCSVCGAMTFKPLTHLDWHDRQNERQQMLARRVGEPPAMFVHP